MAAARPEMYDLVAGMDTLRSAAEACKNAGFSPIECAPQLYGSFTDTTPDQMAAVVVAVWSDVSAAGLSDALHACGAWSDGDIAAAVRAHTMQHVALAASQQGGTRGVEVWRSTGDGQIWTLYQRSVGADWSSWEGPGFKGQPRAMTSVAAGQQNNGNVQLFSLDGDGALWTISQLWPGGDWGAWSGPSFGGAVGP